jgi:DNA-binding NtrC family response regulator
MERAVILETTREIQPTSLPDFLLETRLRKGQPPPPPTGHTLDDALFGYERELILTTLNQNHYSLAKTADQLRITRHALRYRMNRLRIHLDTPAEESAEAPTRKDSDS